MFANILHQDMDFFDMQDNTVGALTSKLSTQPTQLQELLGFNMPLITISFVNLLSSCILSIVVGWKLGLTVVFGALPPLIFAGYLRIRLELRFEDLTGTRFAQSAALASEAMATIRTVASLALERHILLRYMGNMNGIVKQSMRNVLWTMFWYSWTQSIEFLVLGLGFW